MPSGTDTIVAEVLHGAGFGKRLVLAVGEYGNGKSHWLAWFRERAHQEGFATCQLSADGYGAALNHPVRFLPLILGSLALPGTSICGYNDLLYRYLRSIKQAQHVVAELSGRLAYNRGMVGQIFEAAIGVVDAYRRSGATEVDDQVRAAIRTCCEFIGGHRMRSRSSTVDNRATAYRLLEVAAGVAVECGCSGLVLTIDEAESIFTKLSRAAVPGAFRTLAAFWGGPSIKSLRTAVAITPDAKRLLEREAHQCGVALASTSEEPLLEFCDAVAHSRVPEIQCRGIEPGRRLELLGRVSAAYEAAYPGVLSTNGAREAWREFAEPACDLDVPVRELVRLAVDTLDVLRFQ